VTPNPELNPVLVGRKQAAFLLGISIRSLDHLVAKDELPSRRIGRRVLVPYASLVTWAKRDHPQCFEDGEDGLTR
jgi:excisionase family DNA binding protein